MKAQYRKDSSLISEQHNTLVMIDNIIGSSGLSMRPSFEILGGTALLFHGVSAVFTVDIDVANAQTDEIKELIEPFISDMASTVVKLPTGYKERLVKYPEGDFDNIDVFLLSKEDLAITKLYAWRYKDREDLTKTNFLSLCDIPTLLNIINAEFSVEEAGILTTRLVSL